MLPQLLRLLLLGLTVFLITCSPERDKPDGETPNLGQHPEILWDAYGVPHIYAPDLEGVFHAFAWSQMEAHGNLVLKLYAQARGQAAKHWGKDYLANDQRMWRMGVPGLAEQWWQQQDSEAKAALTAFVQGINDYAAAHGDRLDGVAKGVLPVRGQDLMAHVLRTIHFSFIFNDNAERWGKNYLHNGSNAWAIAPARSASGHALLLGNPHLPWMDLFTFFEAHLNGPDLEIYGASLVGHPLIGLGFNRHLGWSHTVNTHDGFDLFELSLVGEDAYQWGDETKSFEVEETVIEVLQEDGAITRESLVIKRALSGPVIAEIDGKALTAQVVGLDQPHLWRQYLDMARAKDLAAFEKAQSLLQMPMFTTIYADREGHIMHFFGGHTPKRPHGDWSTWQSPVAGGPENHWTQIHTYEELPKSIDPPSGWLQNANDPPWTTTFPLVLDADQFPAYMAPRSMSFRAQSSARMLAEDESITFEELIAYKHDTRMLAAERLLDDLALAVAEHGDERAKAAMAVLQAWDGKADAESKGAVLFQAFFFKWRSAFAEPWSESQPRTTPDGLKDPAKAAQLLGEAAEEVTQAYGDAAVPWGDIYRFRAGTVDLPANGGPGQLGIFRVMAYRQNEDGKQSAYFGDTFVFAVAFSQPLQARAVMSYGNASQPGSTHATDQLPLIAAKQMRNVWMDRKDVEANLSSRMVLD